ncbi:hypothetical protein LTR53_017585 [Teratosphaeriaceae sp. CCFEE 6253]|nr:hypothetical protein LTR53_017585 [Teratosphaeriaceae sp. CCFEE 6253]
MAISTLVSLLMLGGLTLASPLEIRQTSSFRPAPQCTNSGGSLTRGYNCLGSNGAATASAYCSSRFVTTSTATGPSIFFTDVTSTVTTGTTTINGTSTSTVTSFMYVFAADKSD